jgi:predicted TIM-barrel fold metal-dependent hydrolase
VILDGYCTCGTERETILPPDALLRQMDAGGADRAVIAPEDREIALHNAAGNQRIARLAAESGGRLVPACSVSPWQGDEAPALLRAAVGAGARMLVLAPAVQGFNPCDPLVDPLLTAAAALNLPVYVHTGPHSTGGPTQVALAAVRHPRTRFILGHCGSTDFGWDMPAVLTMNLENLWYELSFVRPWAIPAYAALLGSDGDSRLIFASSAPRNDLAFELREANAFWPIEEHPGTYGGNLLRLLSEVTP